MCYSLINSITLIIYYFSQPIIDNDTYENITHMSAIFLLGYGKYKYTHHMAFKAEKRCQIKKRLVR